MADKPKREIKQPKRFCTEFSAYTPVKKANPQKKDKKLYDIEVTEVDKANKRLKIHYVGYSSRFDEWRPFGEDEVLFFFFFFFRLPFHFPLRLYRLAGYNEISKDKCYMKNPQTAKKSISFAKQKLHVSYLFISYVNDGILVPEAFSELPDSSPTAFTNTKLEQITRRKI